MGSLEFGFKLIAVVVFSEKYANFIHRQGATDYKAQGQDFTKSFTFALLLNVVQKVR